MQNCTAFPANSLLTLLPRLILPAASNGSVQKVENNRFARADLERRLLMIDDDMDMNALPKTNYIKTIVTSSAIFTRTVALCFLPSFFPPFQHSLFNNI